MTSRNSRFHGGFGDAVVAAYVRGLDSSRDVLFGAIDPATGCIVDLAEARAADAPKTMELGASVLQSHRKRGLAHALVALAVDAGSNQATGCGFLGVADPPVRL
jgi:hypothetical protein